MTSRTKARSGFLFLAVAAAVAVTAPTTSASPQAHSANANTLAIALQGPIQTFNPWQAPSGGNGMVIVYSGLYDTLLRQAPNGKILPSLVTSWKVLSPLKVTMNMRSGVSFDDGTPLDANAVKANFDYAQSTANPGQCNGYLKAVTTTVVSRTSFTLTLRTPNPDLLPEIALCAGFIVNPTALKNNPDALRTTPNGSGPYKYEPSQTVPNSKWVFAKRASHWASATFPFSSFEINFFGDATAAANAARSGQIDFIQSVGPTDTSSGLKLYFTEPNQLRGLAIGDPKGELVKPLGNVLVRRAMNYAIDRRAILKSLYGGKGQVSGCSCAWNQFSPGWTKALAKIYPYDPKKAKQLLRQAGYAKGFSFPAMGSPLDPNAQLLQAIAGYLRAVGINMQVSQNTTTFIPTMLQGQTPSFFENWTITSFAYYNIAQTGGPSAFWNPRHVVDRLIVKDLTRLLHTQGAAQEKVYTKAAVDFANNAWYIAPVVLSNTSAYNSSKLKFAMTVGAPAPFLYNFQRA